MPNDECSQNLRDPPKGFRREYVARRRVAKCAQAMGSEVETVGDNIRPPIRESLVRFRGSSCGVCHQPSDIASQRSQAENANGTKHICRDPHVHAARAAFSKLQRGRSCAHARVPIEHAFFGQMISDTQSFFFSDPEFHDDSPANDWEWACSLQRFINRPAIRSARGTAEEQTHCSASLLWSRTRGSLWSRRYER